MWRGGRKVEFDAADATAPIYPPDQRFQQKLENHKAAVALYVSQDNLCRVHEALRITPAMALGGDGSYLDLIEAATNGIDPEPEGQRFGRFTVIDGGLS